MKKKSNRIWWILIILLIIAGAIIAGYYFSRENLSEETSVANTEVETTPQPVEKPEEEIEAPKIKEPIRPEAKSPEERVKTTKKKEAVQEDPCELREAQVQEFFEYLNGKSYIQRLEEGMDTKEKFRSIVEKLSSNPPFPAGEGLDRDTIIRNIFLFFRILGRKDIKIIKEVLANESDTLELNFELFYDWLISGDRCPDPEGIRPSFEITYLYAGYLVNTIGGKAYLTRRPVRTRLLINYYCIQILYEADKNGMNSYGIDVYPKIEGLINEISAYPDLEFQEHYIEQLMEIQDYYYQKR